MKDYCEELPRNFSTWVQFWDEVVKHELHTTHESVQIFFNEEERRRAKDFEKNATKYSVAYIKDRAFEELMQDRFERKEAIYWTREVERTIRNSGFMEKSTLMENLGRVKRILLTQSYVK